MWFFIFIYVSLNKIHESINDHWLRPVTITMGDKEYPIKYIADKSIEAAIDFWYGSKPSTLQTLTNTKHTAPKNKT